MFPDSLKVQGFFTNNKTTTTHSGMWLLMSDTSGHIETGYGTAGGSTAGARRSKITSGANALATASWQHVVCRLRGATDMDILRDGTDIGGAYSGSGGAIGYAARSAVIGSISGGNFMNGRIAEVGFWSVSLSDAEVTALVRGVSPLMVRPGSLLGYWPVYGQASPEIDLSPSHAPMTLEGTAPLANHAPVGCPFPVAV